MQVEIFTFHVWRSSTLKKCFLWCVCGGNIDAIYDFVVVVIVEKLLSLLPEYVVPYMIHLLAHDPDFTKPQDVDQLRDVKE